MDFQYTCHVVRNDYEDLKTEVVIILDFEMESGVFRKLLNNLIATPLFMPIQTFEFIDEKIGKFSEFYYGDLTNQVEIEFFNRNNFIISFDNDCIRGFIRNEDLNKSGVKSISEMFEGDTINNLVLTNYCYGQKYSEATDAYCISLALKGRGLKHD